MNSFTKLEELVLGGSAEREIQAFLKDNLDLIAQYVSQPSDEYIAFSEFPFGQGSCDFVVFTDRSRMSVVAIEIKGADFSFSTSTGSISAEVYLAAQQVRDRFAHIESNREVFRRSVHEMRDKVESGISMHNSKLGPKGKLLVDPLKDITWKGVVIGGVVRDDEHESKERTKLELNASPHIKYESWASFLRKMRPRGDAKGSMDNILSYVNRKQDNLLPIGCRVRTKIEWPQVPIGTEGIIDEHYQGLSGIGVMVAWDLAGRPLPKSYQQHDTRSPAQGILRDGFSSHEMKHLEVVGT